MKFETDADVAPFPFGPWKARRRLTKIVQQICAAKVLETSSTNLDEIMKTGKAAMCTRIASSKPAPYGDLVAAIQTVELVDIPPGMVLVDTAVTLGEVSSANTGKKPRVMPQTKMVSYLELPADHLVIKVQASGVNYPDLSMMTHVYQARPDPPFCLGYEGAGEVLHVGSKASYDEGKFGDPSPKVGDRVFVNCRINSHSSRMGVPAMSCRLIPDNFDFDEAAGYTNGVGSAYSGIVSRLFLRKDEWCIITGSTGAIGLAAVQIAKKLGAKVIALGSDTKNTGRLDIVKRMGADHVIDYVKTPQWSDIVKKITAGRGAECAYDVVGGDTFMQCVRAMAVGGRIVVGGFVAGFGQLPMNLVLVKGLYVCALTTQFPRNEDAEKHRRQRIKDWAADGSLMPYISHRFPLSATQEALQTMLERQQVGRIIIHPQEF